MRKNKLQKKGTATNGTNQEHREHSEVGQQAETYEQIKSEGTNQADKPTEKRMRCKWRDTGNRESSKTGGK